MPPSFLGALEQVVLLAISHLQGEGYGVSIREEIAQRTGRVVAVGALYTTLHRLEQKGYVTPREGEPTPERGGRAKRFYSITRSGTSALLHSRRTIEAMWNPALTLRGEGA